MALTFLESFDCYGNSTDLTSGKWTTGINVNTALVPGRFGGRAFNGWYGLTRVFPATGTCIIGAAINPTTFGRVLFQFYDDAAAYQIGLYIDAFGRFQVWRGWADNPPGGGVLLTSSSHFLTQNVWNYVEFKVHIGTGLLGASGSFDVHLNNQSILSGSANTQYTTFNTVSAVALNATGINYDDLYIADASGSLNNDFLGDTRVEMLLPTSDVSVALTPYNMMGSAYNIATSYNSNYLWFTVNNMQLELTMADTDGTVSSGQILFGHTLLTSLSRMVIYSYNAGTVGTLLATSDEVIGTFANQEKNYTFSTPLTVTAGTQYWIGIISNTDLSVCYTTVLYQNLSTYMSVSYASGPPTNPPYSSFHAPLDSTTAFIMSVNITGGTNFTAVNELAEDQDGSYVTSNVPGTTDLYGFGSVTADTQVVYGVQVTPMMRKTSTALRTCQATMQTAGMAQITSDPIYPGIDYVYYPVVFNTQSDGATPWTVAAANGIEAGIIVG